MTPGHFSGLVSAASQDVKATNLLWLGWGHSVRLGLFGDDLVFDLFVGGLRDNLFVYEVAFGAIGAAVDDLLGVGVAYAGEFFELIEGSGVDIELVGGRSGLGCRLGSGRHRATRT